MTRETKLNLIALAIVLALLSPGAVMLVRKNLRPKLKPAWMPDPVRNTMAYMVAGELPPGMTRVNPERTAAWIRTLRRERSMTDIEMPVDAVGLPMISENHTFQLIGSREEPNALRVAILSWDERQNEPTEAWSLRGPRDSIPARLIRIETIDVPDLVRQELGENGLLLPPKHVEWIELEFPLVKPAYSSLARQDPHGHDDRVNFVPSFTKPAASTN